MQVKSTSQLLDLINELVKLEIIYGKALSKFKTLYNHTKEVVEIRNGYLDSIYLDTENREIL